MKSKKINYLKKQMLMLIVLVSGLVFSLTYSNLGIGNLKQSAKNAKTEKRTAQTTIPKKHTNKGIAKSVAATPFILADPDSDGDGVTDPNDLDDDNDGILDSVEEGCPAASKVEGTPVYLNNFGTGTTTSTDPYILGHTYVNLTPNDGQYSVTASNTQTATYAKTDLTGNKDAGNPIITSGTTAGRYLMINIDSPNNNNKAIYKIPGINTIIGQSYRFRIDIAGLANGGGDIPNLRLSIKDNTTELAFANSAGLANDDVWRRFNLEFTATTTSVNLEIVNQQPNGGNGNDVGIDNIVFTPLYCDTDGDGIPNSLDLDSDNDGCPDALEGGAPFTPGQLVTASGVLASQTPNKNLGTSVNSNGVPIIAGAGQAIGDSQDNTKTQCADSDNDTVDNAGDLDDDNDGILDANEGQCTIASTSATDGFDSPTVTNINGNNFPNTNPYNGWGVEALGSNAFNIIRVNGTGYASGPDVAQSGTQYVDINGASGYVYKDITLTTATVVSASAWFANRETGFTGYQAWSTNIQIRNQSTSTIVAQGNTINLTKAMGDENWYKSSIESVSLPAGTYRIRMFVDDFGHLDTISYCFSTDTDGDGIPNYLDLDSDGDGCPDAIEGSENVKYNQVNPLTSPTNPGQINVTYNGTTPGTPAQIISTSPAANGVPQLVNNAGNNYNAGTNPSNLAGVADATDGAADPGQGIGDSQNSAINSCKCYKAPATDGNTYSTNHGITAFNRAGANTGNWPMVRQSGWTALEASTKGLVINRMPASTTGNVGEPVDGSGTAVITSPIAGMMYYDTTNDCLKVNVDGTRSGWKCFNTQSCPDEN
ncbi:MAG: hypothetical protein L6262_08445 [Weeksellaceae bacterium]|nr:hypothetical protein [Weeksellaceae bacterium]